MKNFPLNSISKIGIDRILYAIWVLFSIAALFVFIINNRYLAQSHTLTLAVSAAVAVLTLLSARTLKLKLLIYTVPFSVLIVSVFFKYTVLPEIYIVSINRILLIGLSISGICGPLKVSRKIKTIYINLILTLICTEILMRIVFQLTGMDILKRRTELFRLQPGSTFNNVEVNSEGFLGESPFGQADKKWFFIGDSFGVGVVDYEYNFIHMTGESLNIHDINLSQPGFSPYDYYRILDTYTRDIRPEVVNIVLFTGNDVSEWHIPENGWSFENMRTVNLVRNIILLIIHNPSDEYLEHPENELVDVEIRRIQTNSSENVECWDRYTDYIGRIEHMADNRSIPLVFIIIPDRYEIDSVLQSEMTDKMGYRPDFSYARHRTLDILDSLKLKYINTYPYLRQLGADAFATNNTHIGIAGNKAVYEAISEYLKNETIDKR